ncbi:MAG: hypothetical protein RMJ88_15975, partial [Thermogemmata sp.]|nr:hypothetical protein [Thermogemmata sp.]
RETIHPDLLGLAHYAILTIADAPPAFFRPLQDPKWRDFHDLLDSLGHSFLDQVQKHLSTAPFSLLFKQLDELLLLGNFCRQTHFRKLSVRYYETLIQTIEKGGFPERFRMEVHKGHQQAVRELEEFREQRAAAAGNREEIFVHRGGRSASATLEVRCLANRPEIILELLPDSYQVRLSVNEKGRAEITSIRPVQVWGPRGQPSQPPEWEIIAPNGQEYKLIWLKHEKRVRIESPDKVFVVDLNY